VSGRPPDFDELVGTDLAPPERDRLQRVQAVNLVVVLTD